MYKGKHIFRKTVQKKRHIAMPPHETDSQTQRDQSAFLSEEPPLDFLLNTVGFPLYLTEEAEEAVASRDSVTQHFTPEAPEAFAVTFLISQP